MLEVDHESNRASSSLKTILNTKAGIWKMLRPMMNKAVANRPRDWSGGNGPTHRHHLAISNTAIISPRIVMRGKV
jgi:hypothetical protein